MQAPVLERATFACLCLTVCIYAAGEARADEVADADAFLKSGRADAAVALLAPLEEERAGEAAFDAALGAAWLQAGDPARASVALERAVFADPTLAGARLDLAIAYYRMGSVEESRATLLALRALDPPPEAARQIDEYLARIEHAGAQRAWRFASSLASGYDSNANSATARDEFLGFTLTETSRAAESAFYELGADGGVTEPLAPGLSLDADVGLRHRANPDASFVDTTAAQAALGIRHEREMTLRSLSLVGYRLDTDGELNSSGAGVNARYQTAIGARTSIGGFAGALAIRYGSDLDEKNVDEIGLGFVLARLWSPSRRGVVRAELQLGRDSPTHEGSPYGRHLYGIDAALSWRFSTRLAGELGAAWLRSEYDEAFFTDVLDDDRRDTLTRARAGLGWRFGEAWSLDADVSLARNTTNVDVFEYDRVAFTLAATHAWR